MERILFLTHTDSDGRLPRLALETLSVVTRVSTELGGTFTVGVIGAEVNGAATQIATCGAERFLGVSGPEVATSRYGSDAAATVALARKAEATLVIAPGTSRFARALPGAAGRLGGTADTQVTGIQVDDGQPVAERWFYRQRIRATLSRETRPWVLLLASGVAPAWEGASGTATVEAVSVEDLGGSFRTRVIGERSPEHDAQTIRPDADLLFVAGAGWTKKQADGQVRAKEAEGLILDFLERGQASLGSSKSLVDQSTEGQEVMPFMSHLNQVGQTGSTPRHPRGLATCCHGEEPHVVGWRFIQERRAINKDASCGWARGKADVLYVADAFEVMARVNELLAQD